MAHSPPSETRTHERGLTRFTPDVDPGHVLPGVHVTGAEHDGPAPSLRIVRRIWLTLLMSICGASPPDGARTSGEPVGRSSPDAERVYSFSAAPACTTFVLQRSNQLRR